MCSSRHLYPLGHQALFLSFLFLFFFFLVTRTTTWMQAAACSLVCKKESGNWPFYFLIWLCCPIFYKIENGTNTVPCQNIDLLCSELIHKFIYCLFCHNGEAWFEWLSADAIDLVGPCWTLNALKNSSDYLIHLIIGFLSAVDAFCSRLFLLGHFLSTHLLIGW